MCSGPAQVKDLAWWSGLTTTDARRALELANLERVERDELEYFHAPTKRISIAPPHLRLLPNYDELLIGFADRSGARDPRIATLDETAFFSHFVASQGCVIGGYRRLLEKRTTVIDCTLAVTPTADERRALVREVERFGAFLDTPIRLDLRIDPSHVARPAMTKGDRAKARASKSRVR